MVPHLIIAAIGILLIPALTLTAVWTLSHDPRRTRIRRPGG